MFGACSCPAAWQNLAAIRNMALQPPEILVIRCVDLVGAKHTYLAPRCVAAPAAGLWRSRIAVISARRWRGAAAVVVSAPPLSTVEHIVCHCSSSLSKWNIFFAESNRFVKRPSGSASSVVRGRPVCPALVFVAWTSVQHNHVRSDHFRPVALLARLLIIPRAVLEPAFDIDTRGSVQILAAYFGQTVLGNDRKPVGF